MPSLTPTQVEGMRKHLPAVLADPKSTLVIRNAGAVATSEIAFWKTALPELSDACLSDLQIRQLIQRDRVARSGQAAEIWDASGVAVERPLDLKELMEAMDHLPAVLAEPEGASAGGPISRQAQRWKTAVARMTGESLSDAQIQALMQRVRSLPGPPLVPWRWYHWTMGGVVLLGVLVLLGGLTYGMCAGLGLIRGLEFLGMLLAVGVLMARHALDTL